MKKKCILLMFFLASGCTTSMNMGDMSPSKIDNVDSKNYSIGVKKSVYVGEPIIVRKSYKAIIKKNLFKAGNDFSFQGGIASTSINLNSSVGDVFRVAGVNENNNPVVNIPGSIFMFGIDKNGNWDKSVMSPSFWTSPIGSGSQYVMTPPNTTFQPVESTVPFSAAGYINHEIIFTGINSSGINLLYREYTFEDMARSDFKQDLVYPMDTKEIRFRNYLIEVISVSSSEMQFIVKSE